MLVVPGLPVQHGDDEAAVGTVEAVDGNKICTSWRLGDNEEAGTKDQKSLWFRPEDSCYN